MRIACIAVVRLPIIVALAALALTVLTCGDTHRRERPALTLFYAASLEGAVARWTAMFREREGIAVRGEPSGSQDAARKVSELGRAADLVMVADHHVIDWLLVPDHAQWQILFAGNELVIAHSEQSRYAGELTADNWREILLRPDVRVARADEHLAPIGYQTIQVWMLSDMAAGVLTTDTQRSVTARLLERIPPSRVRPDVAKLTALLGTQADYLFVFRNVAHEHHLKYLRLPPAINLSDSARVRDYARAAVRIQKSTRSGESETISVRGSPILYGLTIPRSARHQEAAERFVQLVLSDEGQNVLEDLGFSRVQPALAPRIEEIPPSLKSLVRESHDDTAD